jgi:uncharacterized membrane protein
MKKQLLNYPFIFLVIGLVFGFQMIYVNPPWHANDEDRHFYNAYALSNGVIGPEVSDGNIGQFLPSNLVDNVRAFQGIVIKEESKFNKEAIESLKNVDNNIDQPRFTINPSSGILPFAYLPSALGIGVAKFMGKSPVEIGWFARAGSLLAYLLIVYLALKRMPCYQPLLMAVALSPMALYQAGSISYDGLSYAFLFFYFALVLQYFFQKQPVTTTQILLLVVIAFFQRLSKDGYFILFFSAVVIPFKHFKFKRDYVLMLVGLLLAAYIPGTIWNAYIRSLDLPENAFAGFQKDFLFDGGKNISYHLSQPVHTLFLGIANTLQQGKEWMIGAVGRFGYSYTKMPEYLVILSWLLIIAASMLENKVYRLRFSMIMLIAGIAGMATIIYGFLIVGSPVGANLIFGLQGRYLTPILPFLMAGAMQVNLMELDHNKKMLAISAFVIFILIMSVRFLNATFYL